MDVERTTARTVPARWAVTTVFGINGLLIASFAVRTPSLKQDLDLTAGQLGLLGALFGVAGVLAMQLSGSLTARFGGRRIVGLTSPMLPVLLIGIGVAPEFVTMALAQMVFGAVHGVLDVSMNVHAVAVERVSKRRIMSGCHAAWSIGSIVGSLVGAGAAHVGMSRTEHFAWQAAVLVPVALVAVRFLLPTRADRGERKAESPGGRWTAWRSGWTRTLLVFGAMGVMVMTAEVAVADWSGVFLHEDRQASLGVAGLAYVAFAICQTTPRLVGDRIQARVPATRLLRWSGLTAAAGMAVVVLGPSPWLGIAGYAIVGLGASLALPVLFGAVGHYGAERSGGSDAGAAAMVSRFSTMTYSGMLVGPAVIGWIADLIGLAWTLALMIPCLLGVAAAARGVDTARRTTDVDAVP
ncbi:MAG: MFS transporter [Saccharothrix sp.]|nr:MFS transporter [Saccharothrix sp.]